MSAPISHSSDANGTSFWSIANIVLAVCMSAFTLFWGVALLSGAIRESTRDEKAESAAASATASAAPAAVTTAPATAAPTALAEVTLKPDLANPLAYDIKEFKVKAGQKVKITFNNTHPAVPQPHNIVISKPGTKDKLLAAAMQMATSPDGMAKGFIPESTDILFHTKLLQPNTTEILEFTAPAAGDYPYLCTFPGHGILMSGVMHVE